MCPQQCVLVYQGLKAKKKTVTISKEQMTVGYLKAKKLEFISFLHIKHETLNQSYKATLKNFQQIGKVS